MSALGVILCVVRVLFHGAPERIDLQCRGANLVREAKAYPLPDRPGHHEPFLRAVRHPSLFVSGIHISPDHRRGGDRHDHHGVFHGVPDPVLQRSCRLPVSLRQI